jgi:hypothetical protein
VRPGQPDQVTRPQARFERGRQDAADPFQGPGLEPLHVMGRPDDFGPVVLVQARDAVAVVLLDMPPARPFQDPDRDGHGIVGLLRRVPPPVAPVQQLAAAVRVFEEPGRIVLELDCEAQRPLPVAGLRPFRLRRELRAIQKPVDQLRHRQPPG